MESTGWIVGDVHVIFGNTYKLYPFGWVRIA